MSLYNTLSRRILVLLALTVPVGAFAVDLPEAAPQHQTAQVDRMRKARDHVAAGRWREAIDALTALDESADADWNNLMGYALRRRNPPDLDAAQRYYDAALRLQPLHRGALEYSGELYLLKGDLKRAEQQLEQLARACITPCEEHADLQMAIARFKSQGGLVPSTH